jgi:TetR/AcrR family acrAB operon transcriptional repressor
VSRPLRPELRDLLLQSAASAFALDGYDRVRLDALAADCGVSKGAVYFHFRGKLELFYAAIEFLESELRRRLAESPSSSHPLDELATWLRVRLEFHVENPELERLYEILDTELRGEAGSVLRSGLRTRLRERRAELRTLLQRAASEGYLELADDPASEAFQLLAAFQGALLQHRVSPEDVEPFLDAERFLSNWLRGRSAPRRRRRSPESERPPRGPEHEFQPPF